jgi:hypothetical protein
MKYLKSFNESFFDEIGMSYPEYLKAHVEDDEDDAFEKGMEAKENDCDVEENPYEEEDPCHNAWKEGFNFK